MLRPDGAVDVGVRYSARTDARCFRAHPLDGVSAAERPRSSRLCSAAKPLDPAEYYFRTVLTLEASDPALAELQNRLFLAAAVREAYRVAYTAYRVT